MNRPQSRLRSGSAMCYLVAMTPHRPPLRALVALSGAAGLSGCWGFVCTDELRPTLIVEVRERATGMPAARGATGFSEHESGVLTEFLASGLHVQVKPSGTQLDSCRGSRWFEARFILPSEPTHLLVTNTFPPPVELFSGVVRPARSD